MKICKICGKSPVVGRLLCRACYQLHWRTNRLDEHDVDKLPIKERIEKFAVRTASGCWEWSGMMRKDGYGMIWKNGKGQRAHRVAFEEYKHPLTSKQILCHTCDNRKCINPDHIFIGTRSDNVKDAAAKNRMPINDRHWKTKLSIREVELIRQANGFSHRELGHLFGVAQSTVSRIRSRERRDKSDL